MNWDTAKNWLIMAFLVLDALLGWQLIQSGREMSGYVESRTDLLANTRTLLAQHGFSLITDVPESHPSLPLAAADYTAVSLRSLVSIVFPTDKTADIESFTHSATTSDGEVQLIGPGKWRVEYSHSTQTVEGKTDAAPAIIWNAASYTRDRALNLSSQVDYVQMYQNYPVFDAVVQVSIKQHRVAGYTQTAITNLHAVGDSQPVISALDALNSLANSVDKSNEPYDNKIENIQLGYKQKISVNSDTGSQDTQNYWFPVWRVVTNSGQYFINAFTGEVTTA